MFAGGDVATGPAYVIDAIAAGKRAAASMGLFMKGEPLTVAGAAAEAPQPLTEAEKAELKAKVAPAQRESVPEEAPEVRVTDFREVRLAYGPEAAGREASRCLAGQVEGCIECGECARRCDVKAIDYTMKDETIDLACDGIILAPGFDLYDPTEKGDPGTAGWRAC